MSLIKLAEKWEESAKNAFVSAERQDDDPTNTNWKTVYRAWSCLLCELCPRA